MMNYWFFTAFSSTSSSSSPWFVVIGHCTASRSSGVWTFPCGVFLQYSKLHDILHRHFFHFFSLQNRTEQNRTVCMIICTHSFAYILHMCILKSRFFLRWFIIIFFRLYCLYYTKEEALREHNIQSIFTLYLLYLSVVKAEESGQKRKRLSYT